jgi:hypothetical protein
MQAYRGLIHYNAEEVHTVASVRIKQDERIAKTGKSTQSR